MRKSAALASVVALLVFGLGLFNWLSAVKPLQDAHEADPRNEGIEVFAHHRYFILPGEIVFVHHADGSERL